MTQHRSVPPSSTEDLTIIVTTSPTPSAPTTDLLSYIFQSYAEYCPVLLTCRICVVFDTHERIAEQNRLKKGQITSLTAARYVDYKQNVRDLVLGTFSPTIVGLSRFEAAAEYGSPCIATNQASLSVEQTLDKRVTFIEAHDRVGFGLAVRSALRLVETRFVLVQQHDWVFTSSIPIQDILEIMASSENEPARPVKYVCFPTERMRQYAVSDHVMLYPKLRELARVLRSSFASGSDSGGFIELTPLFFWHDKVHIACTRHYLDRVFPSRLAMPRGAFIEDHVGQLARTQMKQGNWSKWACWLYYPDDGLRICLKHLRGKTWRGEEGQRRHVEQWQTRQITRRGLPAPPEKPPEQD